MILVFVNIPKPKEISWNSLALSLLDRRWVVVVRIFSRKEEVHKKCPFLMQVNVV